MPTVISPRRSREAGQTLIISLLVLGILLVLGLAFTGIVGGNLNRSVDQRQRTVAGDLSEAGVRFAHSQLLNSELGADWRPEPTPPATDGGGLTKDPDALYLRLGSNFPLRSDSDPVIDRGGPDGLGPYSRVSFNRGRALVRVRYAPSDFAAFGAPSGALREPGRARNYLILEAIGRSGVVNDRDPSTLLGQAVKVANFTDAAEFRRELQRLRLADERRSDSRRLIGFASIGIIESGRFITNKFRVSRPAEIGSLTEPSSAQRGPDRDNLGVRYENRVVSIRQLWGGTYLPGQSDLGTGSLYSNADLLIHGRHDVFLNPRIGDAWLVAGQIRGANDAAELRITRTSDNQTATLGNNTAQSFQSGRNSFTTFGGIVRDGEQNTDADGFARAVGYKEPPSILRADPATGLNRYLQMTRNSGAGQGRFNTGRLGYGRGVYVDSAERGNIATEDERSTNEIARSLVNDWLNPNNAESQGWQGFFYVPLAPFVELVPDGFIVTRDSRSRRRDWRLPDGTSTGSSRCRFRVRTINGVPYILNSFVARDGQRMPIGLIDRPAQSLSNDDFVRYGRPFNGVVYFEGDVRVRGIIPTNHQISFVSMGTIYVEGSITKGVVDEAGQVLTEPSSSMLMLMARDYIAVNTTGFFAPAPGEDPNTKFSDAQQGVNNGLEVGGDEARVGGKELNLRTQFLLNPLNASGQPELNPQNWRPYATQYETPGGSPQPVSPQVLMGHWADDGGPSYVQLLTAADTYGDTAPPPSYYSAMLFPRVYNFGTAGSFGVNAASFAFGGTGNIPIFGKGTNLPVIDGFNLVSPATMTFGNRRLEGTGSNPEGQIRLAMQDETELGIRLANAGAIPSKNYVLTRFAIAPHDVRIEAGLYAEEGSFFVIPGPSFNYNIADTRQRFLQQIENFVRQGLSRQQAEDQARLDRYTNLGMAPQVPFYGEPLSVRISIVGAVSENMPPSISQQAEWQRQWGWMPRLIGATGVFLPSLFVPTGYDIQNNDLTVPNLIVSFDPALATGSVTNATGTTNRPIRVNASGAVLPPMPRLPVSPTLAYFGEVNP